MCAVDCGTCYQNRQIKEDKTDWANITYGGQDKDKKCSGKRT